MDTLPEIQYYDYSLFAENIAETSIDTPFRVSTLAAFHSNDIRILNFSLEDSLSESKTVILKRRTEIYDRDHLSFTDNDIQNLFKYWKNK